MASRSTNTMSEFLQRMLGDLAEAKTLPDADLQFLIQLETTILQKLRAPIDALMGQMQQGEQAAGNPMAGTPGMMTPEMLTGLGMGNLNFAPNGQQRVTGTRMEPQMPNTDELRRTMGGVR